MSLNIHGVTELKVSTTYVHHVIEALIILVIGILDVSHRVDLVYWIVMFNVVDWLHLLVYHCYAITDFEALKYCVLACWIALFIVFVLGVVDLDGRLMWTYAVGMGLIFLNGVPIMHKLFIAGDVKHDERFQLVH
jgi:hypothetical protein